MACANLANLMLARASTREREFAVRVAMGASRARVIQQCLAESVLLAAGGAVLGGWLAQGVSRLLVSLVSTDANRLELDVSIDGRVLLFTTLIATVTCLACGLVPAWRASRAEPKLAMRSGGRGITSSPARLSFQRLLIVVQVALSVVLVVGALLFVHSLQNLLSVDTGFQQADILFGIVPLSNARATSSAAVQRTRESILNGIRALPQVQAAATSTPSAVGRHELGFCGSRAVGSGRPIGIGEVYLDQSRVFRHDADSDEGGTRLHRWRSRRQPTGGHRQRDVRAHIPRRAPCSPGAVHEPRGARLSRTRRTKSSAWWQTPSTASFVRRSLPIAFVPVEQHPVLERWAWSVLAIRSTAPVAALTADVQRIVAANGLKSDVVMWRLDGRFVTACCAID